MRTAEYPRRANSSTPDFEHIGAAIHSVVADIEREQKRRAVEIARRAPRQVPGNDRWPFIGHRKALAATR